MVLRRTAGMSLLELLAAVTIITLLSSAAYVGYHNLIPEAKAERVSHDLQTLSDSLGTYDRDHRNDPYRTYSLQLHKGRYLDEVPLDPWGNDYIVDPIMQRIISRGVDGILQTVVPGYPERPNVTARDSDDRTLG